MKKTMKKLNVLPVAVAMAVYVCSFGFVSCGDDEKEGGKVEYDPSKPVVLTSFHPDSGSIASKVIFDGENFGTDPDKIKVYFNQKQAPVVGSSGKRMYAVVPRLPGDTCTISVVVGNDSVVYDQKFRYKISVSVSTIVGNGTRDVFQTGALDQTILWPCGLCIDADGNLFAVTRNDANGNALDAFVKINEEENSVITMGTNSLYGIRWPQSPCVDLSTGVVTFPSGDNDKIGQFYTFDPKEGWACRTRYMKWKEGTTALPVNGWAKATASCKYDGHFYTHFYNGHLVKTHPKTNETEIIRVLQAGDCYGMAFHPLDPKMLYLAFYGNSGSFSHCICTLDITDPEGTFQILSGNASGGYRDGELAVALFRNPGQIFFDPDGNLYIADEGNHCIRKITTENMVETVVGIPGLAGWKDGGKDEALFNGPRGITVGLDGTVYVGDWNNARVRKLAIE
jgi:DNA-binding beta-propeller fold protein YncE